VDLGAWMSRKNCDEMATIAEKRPKDQRSC